MKAQIKIFETIAVLVIFFFFIAFGMNFYFVIQRSEIQKEISRVQDLRSIQTAQKATFLPELDCVVIGVQRENCFDTLKLDIIRPIIGSPASVNVYVPIFGYSTLNVTQIYPSKRNWVLYHRSRPGDQKRFQTPVLLYDPGEFKYGFGVLEVTVYG